jgi:hypothetical protein
MNGEVSKVGEFLDNAKQWIEVGVLWSLLKLFQLAVGVGSIALLLWIMYGIALLIT